jgi:hypothetical protein
MTVLYKGVGVRTFLYGASPRTEFRARMPTLPGNVDSIMRHVALGTTASPYISLTRSYGVAEGYARDAGRAFPTHALPAYVYEFDISTPLPSAIVEVIDPVAEVAARNQNPLLPISYHHDGTADFLLGVIDPNTMAAHLNAVIRTPKGSAPTPRPAKLTIELETIVRALRDAEVLVRGVISNADVTIIRHEVW